jgi:hypothetical protein
MTSQRTQNRNGRPLPEPTTHSSPSAAASADKFPIAQPAEPQEQRTPEVQRGKKNLKRLLRRGVRSVYILHIQLVYETVGSTLQCWMCSFRKREVDPTTRVVAFPCGVYGTGRHCELEHDAALGLCRSRSRRCARDSRLLSDVLFSLVPPCYYGYATPVCLIIR